MESITGKNVLVIGGTGTIGSALVKRLLEHDPAVVRVFSRDEHKQYLMQTALTAGTSNRPSYSIGKARFLLGDIRDKDRLRRAMENVDTVFHLAALKHVPACEYNPFEAVKTNVIGTQNVIDCAIEEGVSTVLYASSDKAAGPTNTMGATKLLAERLISAADLHKGPRDVRFFSVRFGNVLNSRGSVIPLFRQQIAAGGPVTVTNPDMTRFVMDIERAVTLMMEAARTASGGETFVFKMPVVTIGDLAKALIEMSGQNITVENIGLRPGEKMYEELLAEEEGFRTLETDDMFLVLPYHAECSQVEKLYPGARKASMKSYSSHTTPALSLDGVKELLTRNEQETLITD